MKQNNIFVKGIPSAEFGSSLVCPEELVVYKKRVGTFSENQLHLILRSRGIENLALFGSSTSGITLSALGRAFNLDFRWVVLKEASFDAEQEVHRVLTEKIPPAQASVLAMAPFTAEQEE